MKSLYRSKALQNRRSHDSVYSHIKWLHNLFASLKFLIVLIIFILSRSIDLLWTSTRRLDMELHNEEDTLTYCDKKSLEFYFQKRNSFDLFLNMQGYVSLSLWYC